MKLGIVGSGTIVVGLLSFINSVEAISLQAIGSTERSYGKCLEMAKNNNIPNVYKTGDEVINDPSVEVVYVAVPNHLHYEVSKKALLAGKHVICEKPFTSNLKELLALEKLAKEKHLLLWEAITTQYFPNTLKIKELLSEVGNVKIVTANYSQYSRRYDAFKQGNILPAFDYTKSGGALMDLNVYNLHFITALFGAPLSVEYKANIERNIDTSGIVTLDYGNFKASAIGAKDCKAPVVTNIQGDKACISISSPVNTLLNFKLLRNDGSEEFFDLHNGVHRMAFEFKEFVKMFDAKDYDRTYEMLEKSKVVMDIIDKAKASGGVVFANDSLEIE